VDDVFDAFQEMAYQVKKGIIACGDDNYLHKLETRVPVVYYGLSDSNDFQAQNIKETEQGTEFDVFIRNTYFDTFLIPMYGNHHILNALSVIAFCDYEGISSDVMKNLASFGGVKRRFSEHKFGSQVIIDDYAHHPIKITTTIDSVRKKYPKKEIIAIFQPHTYTRTAMFLDEFTTSLKAADHIYLCDIFSSAREETGELTVQDLIDIIPGSQYIDLETVNELAKYEDAVLIFMGAGDIQKYQKAYEKNK